MNHALPSVTANEPLTTEHHQQFLLANKRSSKIRAAAKMAFFNAWVTGFFAVISAPFAIFSLSGCFVTLGLIAVTYNEFRGRRMLLEFDPRAATLLGWNQLGFLTLIIVYSLWMLLEGFLGPNPLDAELKSNPDLQAILGSTDELQQIYKLCLLAVYGTTILLSGIFQGINALYYFTRRQHLLAYIQETPNWILQLQRTSTFT